MQTTNSYAVLLDVIAYWTWLDGDEKQEAKKKVEKFFRRAESITLWREVNASMSWDDLATTELEKE